MVGQIQEGARQRQWREVRERAARFRLNTGALKDAYDKLPLLDSGQLEACGNILQALSAYVWLDHFVRVQNEPLSFKLKEYIAGNICGELSLALLGRKLGAGKTNLCAVCKRDFGMTVNELIRSTRIEQAKKLLQAGDESIAAIAEQVGILDYNYFSKVFKSETGLSPSAFRRLCEEDHLYVGGRKGRG
jgi:AraC-like DNA-binding protein